MIVMNQLKYADTYGWYKYSQAGNNVMTYL